MLGVTNNKGIFNPYPMFLYKTGDQCTNLTGGWATVGDLSGYTRNGGSGGIRGGAYTTWGSDNVIVNAHEDSGADGGINFIATKNPIDISDIGWIHCNIIATNTGGSERRATLYVCTNKYYMGRGSSWSGYGNYTNVTPDAAINIGLDVGNLTGLYYIGLSVFQWSGGWDTQVTVDKIYLDL